METQGVGQLPLSTPPPAVSVATVHTISPHPGKEVSFLFPGISPGAGETFMQTKLTGVWFWDRFLT